MPSIFIKSLIVATVFASSVPALAAPTASPQKTVLKYDAKKQKYCLTEPATTGTFINRVTCLTSAQWSAAGLDMPRTVVLAQK